MSPPTDDQSYVQNLKQMRANLMQEILTEQQARLTAGTTKATYSLGNRNVSWNEWLTAMRAELRNLDQQIQSMDIPYELNTRYYS